MKELKNSLLDAIENKTTKDWFYEFWHGHKFLLKEEADIITDARLDPFYDYMDDDQIRELIRKRVKKMYKKKFPNAKRFNLPIFKSTKKPVIFTDAFLKEIKFTLIERKMSEFKPYHVYGKAKDRTGMTIIEWNEEGHSCTYFGEKLEPNTSVGILKDGGTRHAFNGYVYTQDDFRKILSLTL